VGLVRNGDAGGCSVVDKRSVPAETVKMGSQLSYEFNELMGF
jgi:hypothetical protein